MRRFLRSSLLILMVSGIFFASSMGYAGLHPKGWLKGKKTGWKGENVPPGLSKKETKKKGKRAKKEAKEMKKTAEAVTEQAKQTM